MEAKLPEDKVKLSKFCMERRNRMASNDMINMKLAEWAGWVYGEKHRCPLVWWWTSPDGCGHDNPPSFTTSLDACFQELIPRLELCNDDGLKPIHPCFISIENYATSDHWTVSIMPELYECYKKYEVSEETPALALCLAILKLIEEG